MQTLIIGITAAAADTAYSWSLNIAPNLELKKEYIELAVAIPEERFFFLQERENEIIWMLQEPSLLPSNTHILLYSPLCCADNASKVRLL